MIKRKLFAVVLCVSALFPVQAQMQQCKIDRLNITKIKTLKPATGLTDLSTTLISELVQEAVTFPIGYALKPAKKISRLAISGYYSQKRAIQAGEFAFGQGLNAAVKLALGAIDSKISDQDDLIFRIGGRRVAPPNLMYDPFFDIPFRPKFFPMSINDVYPETVTGSFIGSGEVQIIEYDSGSMNDDLATFEFQDETLIDGALVNEQGQLNSDTITLFTAAFGDNSQQDNAIYELDYNVEPGKGVLSEIPERLVCDYTECKDYREPITNYTFDFSYLGSNPAIEECPTGYDYDGYIEASGWGGTQKFSVCEFRPHEGNNSCGSSFYASEYLNEPATLLPGTTITLKQNILSKASSDGSYLSSTTGQYLATCDDCAYPSAYAHALDPNRQIAQWRINQLDNGKFTLQANNGKYLALCDGCVPSSATKRAFPNATSPHSPLAQFTIERAPTDNANGYNDYTIGIDIDGVRHYLSACLNCEPVPRLGFAYSATFHITDNTNPFTHWHLDFKLNTQVNAISISDKNDGIFDKDITIPNGETWVNDGVMTIKYGRTLTIEDGAILVNEGTLINEGTIKIGYMGSIDNEYTGTILNKEIILLRDGTINNEGVIDNNLANYFIQDGTITDRVGGDIVAGKSIIFDSYNKFKPQANSITNNRVVEGYYLDDLNASGKQSCALIGGIWDNTTNNICTVTNGNILEGKLLFIDRNVDFVVNGILTNEGTIFNNGAITNINGNIRQCGDFDTDGEGTISNDVLPCVRTADEDMCRNYSGTFDNTATPKTCRFARGDVIQGTSLTISSGITWYLSNGIENSGNIYIEKDAALIVTGSLGNGRLQYDLGNDVTARINNHGLLSVDLDDSSGTYGTIRNEGLINNNGDITNLGDVVGFGEIRNICDASYEVTPDWSIRLGPNAGYGYDPEGENHFINSYACSPFDTDEDGTPDVDDAFPYDPSESADSDGDGVGDNTDWAPNDPSESADSDSDNVGDNADAFPNDASETKDSDNDGVGDNADVFPDDPKETNDRDKDGVGDNEDRFPDDPTESLDYDDDRIGDNTDAFPNDSKNTRLMSVASQNGWTLGRGLFLADDGERSWDFAKPSGFSAPFAMASFGLFSNSQSTEAKITLTYPEPINPQLKWWKYGREADGGDSKYWYVYENAVISGNTVTITLTDGAKGDDDYIVNGVTVALGALAMIDTDDDGIPDDVDTDDDNDGYLDTDELANGTNSLLASSVPTDNDGDFISDLLDNDDDNDGVLDLDDAFPFDASESVDTDGDGIGNNADTDDDNDGVLDVDDEAPLDAAKSRISKKDVDGDGTSDLLWRSSARGWNFLWAMNGTQTKLARPINVVQDDGWLMAGQGDYDGDGKSDILWRNTITGLNFMYLMDGLTIKTRRVLNYVDAPQWELAGSGDFNGDGKGDVLWHDVVRGRTQLYLMDGLAINTNRALAVVTDLNEKIVAIGDVNGDGTDDVIWRNQANGNNSIWLMENGVVTDMYVLNRSNLDWSIAGAGDLDGDGTDDIVLRNQVDGRNYAFMMENGQIRTSQLINTVSLDWQIANMGDYDGDGKTDFLWRNEAAARNIVHLMDGVIIKDRGVLRPTDNTWAVAK